MIIGIHFPIVIFYFALFSFNKLSKNNKKILTNNKYEYKI